MADSRDRSGSGGGSAPGSSLVLSVMAGAVLGAAGLAWWLLSESDRRRQALRQLRMLRLSPLGGGNQELQGNQARRSSLVEGASSRPADGRLQDRVQQLNQQIDEVRRQLEQMQTLP